MPIYAGSFRHYKHYRTFWYITHLVLRGRGGGGGPGSQIFGPGNSTGIQPNGVSNAVGNAVANGVGNGVNGVSHDKMAGGEVRNGQSQASKDLQAYFEDLHKYKNIDQYRNG